MERGPAGWASAAMGRNVMGEKDDLREETAPEGVETTSAVDAAGVAEDGEGLSDVDVEVPEEPAVDMGDAQSDDLPAEVALDEPAAQADLSGEDEWDDVEDEPDQPDMDREDGREEWDDAALSDDADPGAIDAEVEAGATVEAEQAEGEGRAMTVSAREANMVAVAPPELHSERLHRKAPDIQYAKRVSRKDRQDRGWWVEGDYLIESDGGGGLRRTHLGDILEVQVAPAPAKFRPWRHQTVLGLRNSRRIAIDNAHYVGTANYEDRSREYAPFVRRLIDRIVEAAPYAKARRGASYIGYVAMLAFVMLLITMVAVLLFMLPIDGVPGIVFIKLALVGLMAPPLFLWVAKSRPTGMPLAELPAGALPRAKR